MLNGKEAKLAWANGEAVQIECTGGFFELLEHREFLNVFDNPKNKFRLKPQTVKIMIEVPAPFEPKEGDVYWYLTDAFTGGYEKYTHNKLVPIEIGAWRTEEEIKQVVAELRKLKCTT